MSILLRHADIPKYGHRIVILSDGHAYYEDFANPYVDLGEVVKVPPHGDLTDRDAYRDEFMSGVYDLCDDDPDNCRANAIIDLFDSAPTIIQAEPPKEEQ